MDDIAKNKIVYSCNPFNRVQDILGIVPPFKVNK